jgi:gas vesicle protein
MTDHGRSDEQHWQSGGRGSAIGWLLAGIAVGAVAALLLAPSTGRELRHAITGGFRHTFGIIGSRISQQARGLRARGSNLLSFTRQPTHKSQQS